MAGGANWLWIIGAIISVAHMTLCILQIYIIFNMTLCILQIYIIFNIYSHDTLYAADVWTQKMHICTCTKCPYNYNTWWHNMLSNYLLHWTWSNIHIYIMTTHTNTEDLCYDEYFFISHYYHSMMAKVSITWKNGQKQWN